MLEIVVKREIIWERSRFKEKLTLKVHQDEDVLFWWSILCDYTDLDYECSKALVPYVVVHYAIITGFSFLARWMKVFRILSLTI